MSDFPQLPTEVELMAKEFIRTCIRHNVGLTGFVFSLEPTFVMHISNLTDDFSDIRAVHGMLCDALDDSEKVKRITVHKNDA